MFCDFLVYFYFLQFLVCVCLRKHWIQTLQNLHIMSGKQIWKFDVLGSKHFLLCSFFIFCGLEKQKNYKTKNVSSVVIVCNASIFCIFVFPTFVSNEVCSAWVPSRDKHRSTGTKAYRRNVFNRKQRHAYHYQCASVLTY